MTDQAPELLDKIALIIAENLEIDGGHYGDGASVSGIKEAAEQIFALWNTRLPSERPVAQVREALGTLLQKYRPIAKQSWPVAGGRLCRTQRKINDARQIVVILEGAIATLTAERPEAAVAMIERSEFEIVRKASRLFEDAANAWMERALKAEAALSPAQRDIGR